MLTPLMISFEFYPPKTLKGASNLRNAVHELARVKPEFFSVTFGAGGSTQSGTLETVRMVRQESRCQVAPHISCIGTSKKNIEEMLEKYQADSVKRLVVLRGDLPKDQAYVHDFNYACELVNFIRQKTGNQFHIEVAAYPEFHPEAKSASSDVMNLKRKYEAGANSAITQYFYNPDAYFYLLDECAKYGVTMPIVPGIMPITHFESLARFSDRCGAEIPLWLRKRLQDFAGDDASLKEFGLEVVYKLCQRLIAGGAPGLHFYTLNKSEATLKLLNMLKVGLMPMRSVEAL